MSDMLRLHHEHRATSGFEPNDFARAFAPVANADTPPFSVGSDLRATIARHVIPRLHLALAAKTSDDTAQGGGLVAGVADVRAVGETDVDRFVHELVRGRVASAVGVTDDLLAAGCTLEVVFLQLLAPAALQLRRLQSDDAIGLAEASLAYGDLGAVLRHYAQDFRNGGSALETGLRVLLVSPVRRPVALSVFGLLLLSEFFRRDGWDSWIENEPGERKLCDLVLDEWFDLVEVIAPDVGALDAVEAGIKAIRRGSRNRALGVIVCGEIFREHPRFVRLVGADLAAVDPLGSIVQARQIIGRSTTARRLI